LHAVLFQPHCWWSAGVDCLPSIPQGCEQTSTTFWTRRVLVDFARARKQHKRNGGSQVSFDEALTIGSDRSADIVALDDALTTLAKLDRRQSQIVELRFFGGLTEPHIARVLGVSPRTVSSEWRLARSWLLRELNGDDARDA